VFLQGCAKNLRESVLFLNYPMELLALFAPLLAIKDKDWNERKSVLPSGAG